MIPATYPMHHFADQSFQSIQNLQNPFFQGYGNMHYATPVQYPPTLPKSESCSPSDESSPTSSRRFRSEEDALRYREKRSRNNEAAKKSRLNRKHREKELQDRVNVLTQENEGLKRANHDLKREHHDLKRENQILRQQLYSQKSLDMQWQMPQQQDPNICVPPLMGPPDLDQENKAPVNPEYQVFTGQL